MLAPPSFTEAALLPLRLLTMDWPAWVGQQPVDELLVLCYHFGEEVDYLADALQLIDAGHLQVIQPTMVDQVTAQKNDSWPIFVQDRQGHTIYLTWERWDHALGHPGMDEGLLELVLETLRKGRRKQDAYDPAKYK